MLPQSCLRQYSLRQLPPLVSALQTPAPSRTFCHVPLCATSSAVVTSSWLLRRKPPPPPCIIRQFNASASSQRWLRGGGGRDSDADAELVGVTEGMKRVYREKLLPLEKRYLFHEFHSPLMQDADFEALPMILLVGQYSTGKTTFIRHLLDRDFPGIRVGPEPTTDRFIVITHSNEDGVRR